MSDWEEIEEFYTSLDGELRETGRQMALFVRRLRKRLPSTSVPFTSLTLFGLRMPEGEWFPAAEWTGEGSFEVCSRNWKTFEQRNGRRQPMDDAVLSFIECAASLQSGGALLLTPVAAKKKPAKKNVAKKRDGKKKPAAKRKLTKKEKPTAKKKSKR